MGLLSDVGMNTEKVITLFSIRQLVKRQAFLLSRDNDEVLFRNELAFRTRGSGKMSTVGLYCELFMFTNSQSVVSHFSSTFDAKSYMASCMWSYLGYTTDFLSKASTDGYKFSYMIEISFTGQPVLRKYGLRIGFGTLNRAYNCTIFMSKSSKQPLMADQVVPIRLTLYSKEKRSRGHGISKLLTSQTSQDRILIS